MDFLWILHVAIFFYSSPLFLILIISKKMDEKDKPLLFLFVCRKQFPISLRIYLHPIVSNWMNCNDLYSDMIWWCVFEAYLWPSKYYTRESICTNPSFVFLFIHHKSVKHKKSNNKITIDKQATTKQKPDVVDKMVKYKKYFRFLLTKFWIE